MWKKIILLTLLVAAGLLTGCGSKKEAKTEIQVFVAASLGNAVEELAESYEAAHPEIKVILNADSSGTLLNQIREGYECDIFFSAAERQMDELEAAGLLVKDTRADVLENQAVVIARKDSQTKVTGLKDMGKAESIAFAGSSVPVGRYARQALISLGMLLETEEVSKITAQEISEALGGVEISEQDNVSKVLMAVAEGSCEAGCVYYSDIHGYEDELTILERVDTSLTGEVRYPAARVVNEEADNTQTVAAEEFFQFILSDEAKTVFDTYYFDTEIER